jgi:hypothetical protein
MALAPRSRGKFTPDKQHQMPFILKQTLALPLRALTWLGGQGTRAVAALVFIGIAVPPLGKC